MLNTILYKDILVKNKLTNEKALLELIYFLTSNVSKLISYNSLTKVIGVNNATTVKNYLNYIEKTYLIFLVNKFDYSVKKQIQNPKKIYFIDTAFASNISFSFSENKGRILENIVFLELKRRGLEVYYHKNKFECDFIIHFKNEIQQAIQVSVSLTNTTTKEREIQGLIEAMEIYNLQSGLIITEDEDEIINYKNNEIHIKPVWKWLLEK